MLSIKLQYRNLDSCTIHESLDTSLGFFLFSYLPSKFPQVLLTVKNILVIIMLNGGDDKKGGEGKLFAVYFSKRAKNLVQTLRHKTSGNLHTYTTSIVFFLSLAH